MKMKAAIPLLFASLIAFHVVHDAIPHHHHLNVISQHQSIGYPCCDQHSHCSTNSDTACHAFNDLVYYQTNVFVLIAPGITDAWDPYQQSDQDLSLNEGFRKYTADHNILLRDYKIYLNIHGLRAPPAAA